MYLKHYKLKIKPFDLSPRPDLLWLGEKHKEALSALEYGILHNMGFVLLTGEVGVGKTALIRRLISSLDAETLVAHITDPALDIPDFFRILADHFKLDRNLVGKGEFLIEFEKFLRRTHAAHKKVLLIVDEAQRLNNELLDQIRVLSNIELNHRKLISIFLVGQPELKKILLDDVNRAVRQRIAINYHIDTLTGSETAQYIDHRLTMAGATARIFQPDAIREIYRYSEGHPRLINIICDYALLTGYSDGVETIDAEMIIACKQDLAIAPNIPIGINAAPPHPASGPAESTAPPAGSSMTAEPRQPPRWSMLSSYPAFIASIAIIAIMLAGVAGYYGLRPDHVEELSRPPQTVTGQHAHPPAEANGNREAMNSLDPERIRPQHPISPEPAKAPTPKQPVPIAEPIALLPDPPPVSPDSDRTMAVSDPTTRSPKGATGIRTVAPDSNTDAAPRKERPREDAIPVKSPPLVPDRGSADTEQRANAAVKTPTFPPPPAPETRLQEKAPSKPPPRPEMERPPAPAPQVAQADLPPPPAPQQPISTAPSRSEAADLELQQRLSAFLESYCATYEAKDLGAFRKFFAPDAVENGQPFNSLLPKYERNFSFIETIEYRIELRRFSYDVEQEMVNIEGQFSLKWLPPDKRWRENGGKISMRLAEEGSSFVVHRLDYHGGQPPSESSSSGTVDQARN